MRCARMRSIENSSLIDDSPNKFLRQPLTLHLELERLRYDSFMIRCFYSFFFYFSDTKKNK